jgi:hypothetical protein
MVERRSNLVLSRFMIDRFPRKWQRHSADRLLIELRRSARFCHVGRSRVLAPKEVFVEHRRGTIAAQWVYAARSSAPSVSEQRRITLATNDPRHTDQGERTVDCSRRGCSQAAEIARFASKLAASSQRGSRPRVQAEQAFSAPKTSLGGRRVYIRSRSWRCSLAVLARRLWLQRLRRAAQITRRSERANQPARSGAPGIGGRVAPALTTNKPTCRVHERAPAWSA